jgi:hypothetical protein
MSPIPKSRKTARPRDLQRFADPYYTVYDLCDLIGGRAGGPAHVNTINAMIADGRLPPPDIGGGRKGPRKWRSSRATKAVRRLERRAP